MQPQVQIGEPWWWVTPSGAICLYDDAAKAALGGDPVEIADVRGNLDAAQTAPARRCRRAAGGIDRGDCRRGQAAAPERETLLLVYLPTVLDPAAPELRRANLPTGWARPAFDVLQIEDYEWVTGERRGLRAAAYAQVEARLGYPPSRATLFFGLRRRRRAIASSGGAIVDAARRGAGSAAAPRSSCGRLPQVLRDGLTLFGEEQAVTPFDDVLFPIEIGAGASVAPNFLDQRRDQRERL